MLVQSLHCSAHKDGLQHFRRPGGREDMLFPQLSNRNSDLGKLAAHIELDYLALGYPRTVGQSSL